MIQMATQMAAALSCWDKGSLGLYLWLSVALKALVVGVVSMQRLDDRRLVSNLKPSRESQHAHDDETHKSWSSAGLFYYNITSRTAVSECSAVKKCTSTYVHDHNSMILFSTRCVSFLILKE